MTYSKSQGGLDQYKKVGAQSGVETADPHRLIQMLMEGAIEKIHIAKSHMMANRIGEKATYITWAMSIIDGLRMSLDKSAGGDIAQNLEDLYDYMNRRLLAANLKNDTTYLDEVVKLMQTIKDGWDAIPDDIIREHADKIKGEPPAISSTGG